ncbi:MAG: methylmalonyl-CoA mutase family protein [Flavobacteriaceae bacterium]
MNSTNKALFSEFKPITKAEWIEKATTDLKGADFSRKLVWQNLNGVNFQPFYNTEDTPQYLDNTGQNAHALTNYRSIAATSAVNGNQEALRAVKEGITGLVFEINKTVSASQLLNGINLNAVAVSFVLNENIIDFATDFFAFAEQNIEENKNLKGYIDLNLIPNYVTKGSLDMGVFEVLGNLSKLSEKYPNFKTITLSGAPFLDAGSNQVQEIAYTLNALVYIVEQCLENDHDISPIFNNLHFQLAIGAEYFIEIAKFRAFNSLLHAVAKIYGINHFNYTVMAKTSVWGKSVTDAHTNMLRATTEAMSAILGNADGVLIDAYDAEFKEASHFSSRIAGNIATILKEESYFGKVANPVDGSYYIEEATAQIAEKALELFKTIEAAGGFYTAFEEKIIQQQIAEIRQEKIKLLSQRRLTMVGVNKYPNLMETVAASTLSKGEKSNDKLLTPRRATLEIEAVRKVTEQLADKAGKRPIVALTSFGNLTMRKARAAFAYDFLGVSGFNILEEKSFNSAEEAAQTSATSNANVVVICSSDADYDQHALTFVKTFRALNADKVLLLAGNPVDIIDDLNKAGLDGCIHLKSDVVQTLSKIQKKVEKNLNV